MVETPLSISEGILLAPYTTLGLGGPARYFAECRSLESLREALAFASQRGLRVQILGGGSNSIFADSGYEGLVIHMASRGVSFSPEGNSVIVRAAAGEDWDALVRSCVEKGLAGIECLAGIPGSVGATPIQNVGAYGQEVSATIVSLQALDRTTAEIRNFAGEECQFGYRQSRFKGTDRNRYIITEVTYRLQLNGTPAIRYAELQKYIEAHAPLSSLRSGREALTAVWSAVIALRRKKSMVLDASDPNTKSVGSFFMNPVLSRKEFEDLQNRWSAFGRSDLVPTFAADQGVKIPAAWLVEKSGFARGFREGGVGISTNHSLALINCGGTSSQLVALAMEIRKKVEEVFGIRLELEPEVIS